MTCLWYQVDEGDSDIASFFYYLGIAGKRAAPRRKKPLPLLTPERLPGLSVFTKRFFEDLFGRIKTSSLLARKGGCKGPRREDRGRACAATHPAEPA